MRGRRRLRLRQRHPDDLLGDGRARCAQRRRRLAVQLSLRCIPDTHIHTPHAIQCSFASASRWTAAARDAQQLPDSVYPFSSVSAGRAQMTCRDAHSAAVLHLSRLGLSKRSGSKAHHPCVRKVAYLKHTPGGRACRWTRIYPLLHGGWAPAQLPKLPPHPPPSPKTQPLFACPRAWLRCETATGNHWACVCTPRGCVSPLPLGAPRPEIT